MNAAYLFPSRQRPLTKGPWYAVPLMAAIVLALLGVFFGVWAAAAWAIRAGVSLVFPHAADASLGAYSAAICAVIALGVVFFAPGKGGKWKNGVRKGPRWGLSLGQRGLFVVLGLYMLVQTIGEFRAVP